MRPALATLLVWSLTAVSAWAQPPARAAAPRAIELLVSGGAAVDPARFAQSFAVPINAEDAAIAADVAGGAWPFLEAGVRAQLGPRVSIGAVGFFAAGTTSATVDAQLPHPFYFNQPRAVIGDVTSLERRELGVHVELGYTVPVGSRQLLLFAGPSVVRIEQQLITNVDYSDAYPYDSAAFTGASRTAARRMGAGFNVGAETAWRLGPRSALAALVRYSRAASTLEASQSNTAEVVAGGVQLGAGLRLRF